VATRNRPSTQRQPASARASQSGRKSAGPAQRDRTKLYLGGAGIVVVVLVGLMAVVAIAGGALGQSKSDAGTSGETAMTIAEGSYTNVTADHLADMLKNKDFTLVNVKTPYIGEIDGTDLYIPYDQLTAKASALPQTKSAKILVYCRSGVESLEAVKTLLKMGYTNVWNLDGGMNAWTGTGRALVQKSR